MKMTESKSFICQSQHLEFDSLTMFEMMGMADFVLGHLLHKLSCSLGLGRMYVCS